MEASKPGFLVKTTQASLQQKLGVREHNQRYRWFFENAAEGFFRSTPEGQFTEVNPALVRMLGYDSAEEVVALAIPDDLYANPRYCEVLRTHCEATRPREGVELQWKKKDGTPLLVNLSTRAIYDTLAHVIAYEGIVVDITGCERPAEARQAEAAITVALARVEQELTHANRLKSDFLETMSHELRTPLNIIFGYTSFLLEGDFGPLTAEQTKMLKGVEQSTRQLLELTSAIFEAGRFERGRPTVNRTEVKVTELIAELKRETEHMQDKPGVFFVWRVVPALPRLYTDPTKLTIILKNLLSNAVKFTPEGSVTVEVCAQGNGVEFRVIDTGIGIAPEVMPVIFELFRQGDSSAARRYGGIGLGLYIVRQMVELLGGTVTVESEVGCGSTFRVWLPFSAQ
jgi:PAS domain S-box-containing protein